MWAYAVFGDPRRTDQRRIYRSNVNPTDVAIHETSAAIRTANLHLEGGLLGFSYDSLTNGDLEAYVSILVSADVADAATHPLARNADWEPFASIPYPDALPFLVHVTLVVPVASKLEEWEKPMWMTHAYVPTQRASLRLTGTPEQSVRCLDMNIEPGDIRVTFYLEHNERSEDTSFLTTDKWERRSHNSPTWRDDIRLSGAVEATVAYLLSATIVDGVILHDVHAITPEDVAEGRLPSDVRTELLHALREAGRSDLLPRETEDNEEGSSGDETP